MNRSRFGIIFLILLFFFNTAIFAQEEEAIQEETAEDEVVQEEAVLQDIIAEQDAVPQTGNTINELREELLDAEAAAKKITEEAKPDILSLTVNDTDVSLFLTGYWKGTLTGKWGLSKTPLGLNVAANDSPILFMQEADLMLSLWIKNKFFVEASFEEDYNINSYRAGYSGGENDVIKYLGIGNKGLDFPEIPYLDFGGDSSSSVGLYGKFGSGNALFHTLFRYDTAVREERVFQGERERTYAYLPIKSPQRGISYVLPNSNIDGVITVYFEDKEGPLEGGGRRWRQAKSGEYAASGRLGFVELAVSPELRVAVSYPADYEAYMGNYGNISSFLGETQAYFYESDLTQYPQCGQETVPLGDPQNRPAVITINGVSSLIIYEKGAFSPFERQGIYKAPSSNSAGASLVDASTDERMQGFTLTQIADGSFFNELPLYVNEAGNNIDQTFRNLYEIVLSGEATNIRSPRSRWPLAQDISGRAWNYLVYLTVNETLSTEIRLRWTNLGSSSGFNIGKDVVPGTVEVLRSGLKDPNFSFDAGSGVVQLQNPVSFNEVIRISYLKRSNVSKNGSIVAGVGADIQFSERIKNRTVVGFRWNVDSQSYSEEGATSPGNIGFSNKLTLDFENLKADINLGAGFEQPDTTGLYRAAGMEGNEVIVDLSEENSFISEAPRDTVAPVTGLLLSQRADLVYRNYKNTDFAGITSLMDVNWSGASVVSDKTGPYPVKDPSLGTNVLAAEFTLDSAHNWTGFESPLGDGNILSEAREILIPFRFKNFGANKTFRFIIQIGALAAKGDPAQENPELIVQKELYPTRDGAAITYSENAGMWTFVLTDMDRRKLTNAKYIRVLVINDGSNTVSGKVLLAPPIVRGSKFTPLLEEYGNVLPGTDRNITTIETIDDTLHQKYSSEINRLHPEGAKQRVLEVKWSGLTANQSAGAGGRVGRLLLSKYKTLSFFIKGNFPQNSNLDFIAGRGISSISSANEIAMRTSIPAADLNNSGASTWTKVELRYASGTAEVWAGGKKTGASLSYNPDALKKNSTEGEDSANDSAYIMFFLHPAGGAALDDGAFSIDEIILEESVNEFWLNSGGNLHYNTKKPIIVVNGKTIVENFNFDTSLETAARGNPLSDGGDNFFGAVQRSRAGVVILGINLEGKAAYQAGGDNFWWNGGHSISKTIGPVSIGESFFLAPFDNSWNHNASISLAGPVQAAFNAGSIFDGSKKNRNWSGNLGVEKIAKIPLGLSLSSETGYVEEQYDKNISGDYGEVWGTSWNAMIPDTGNSAERRNFSGTIQTRLGTKPVGANLSLNGNSGFTLADSRTQSAADISLGIPFTFGSYNGEFREDRTFGRSTLFAGYGLVDDLAIWRTSIGASGEVLGAIPIYALFDPDLGDKMYDALNSNKEYFIQSGTFTDRYRFFLTFPAKTGLTALVFPRSFEAHINRNISQTYDTVQDILGMGGAVNFSAVNLFGAFGAKKLFNFYQNDDFTNSFSTAVALPKDNDPSWRLQIDQSISFFGFLGAELQFRDTIAVLSNGWTAAFNIDWISPAPKSLLGTIYNWIFSKFSGNDTFPALSQLGSAKADRFRQESLELTFDKSSADLRWNLTAGHKSMVRVLGHLNLEVFANITVSEDKKTEILSFIGAVGTSLNISY